MNSVNADGLTADEQESVNASVILLQKRGPDLGFPHSSGVAQSHYSQTDRQSC